MNLFFIKSYLVRAVTFAHLQRFFAFLLWVPLPPKISVAAIIKRDEKFLVVDLSYKKGYGLPGGLVDPGETLEEAVAREVREETGLTTTSLRYIVSKKHVQYGLPVIVAVYEATVSGTTRGSNEGSVNWVSTEEYLNHAAYKNSRDAFVHYLEHHESH